MTEGKEYTPPDIVRALPIDEIPVDRLENPRIVSAPNGKLAFGTDEGVGYKEVNEDALVVNTGKNAYAVFDGLGSYGGGAKAARLIAEEFQKGFREDLPGDVVHKNAYDRLKAENIDKDGACYVAFKIDQNFLHGHMAGDVRLVILLPDGRVFFETRDESDLESVGGKTRDVVLNAISGEDPGEATPFNIELFRNMRIIVASDGLWKNFSTAEVSALVHGKSIERGMAELNREVKAKMQTPDGKPDNISILMYDIEHASDGAELSEPNLKLLLRQAKNLEALKNLVRDSKDVGGMPGDKLCELIEAVEQRKIGTEKLPTKDGVKFLVERLL